MWFKKKIEQDILSEERKLKLIEWMGAVMPDNRLFGEVTEEELKKMLTESMPDTPLKVEQVDFWIEARKAALHLSPKTKEDRLFVEGMIRSPWKEYALEITSVRDREERMIPEGDNVFAHFGDRWYVRFNGGKPTWFDNSRGMHYISYLLNNPGKDIFVSVLESDISGMEVLTGLKKPEQTIQEQSDNSARANYKKRMIEIVRDMKKARADHNVGELEKLQDELELLQKESKEFALSDGTKVGRPFSDNKEQARDRVRKAIDKCLQHMEIRDKKLANHLNNSISKGFNLMYSPDSKITWQF